MGEPVRVEVELGLAEVEEVEEGERVGREEREGEGEEEEDVVVEGDAVFTLIPVG